MKSQPRFHHGPSGERRGPPGHQDVPPHARDHRRAVGAAAVAARARKLGADHAAPQRRDADGAVGAPGRDGHGDAR